MPWGAIAMGAGSLLGGLFGGRKSKQEKALMDAQTQLTREQMQMAKDQFAYAKSFVPKIDQYFGKAQEGYTQGLDYYNQLMSGGQGAVNALLGPQRSDINRGYMARVQNLAQRGPRGGGTNAMLAGLDAERQGQLIDAVLGIRPEALKGILGLSQAQEGLGQNYGNLALGFSGVSGSNLSGAHQGFANLLGNEQANKQLSAQKWSAIGQGVGDMFNALAKKYGWF